MGDAEVGPLEPDDLASAHPGVGGEVQRRVEPLASCGGEERAELGSRPRPRDTAGGWASSATRVTSNVAVDEPTGNGVIERGADDGVDLEDGLGSAASAVCTAGGGEGVVEGVEVVGAQAT